MEHDPREMISWDTSQEDDNKSTVAGIAGGGACSVGMPIMLHALILPNAVSPLPCIRDPRPDRPFVFRADAASSPF